MIPLKINNTHLCKIFEPTLNISTWTDEEIQSYSIEHYMFPTSVDLISETFSRDSGRTADYELKYLTIVNRKSKPQFTWDIIKAEYVEKLLTFLNYSYEFKNASGEIVPINAEDINVTYKDFIGMRTIVSYLGQTIEGTLEEYNGNLYWRNFRIAFPER